MATIKSFGIIIAFIAHLMLIENVLAAVYQPLGVSCELQQYKLHIENHSRSEIQLYYVMDGYKSDIPILPKGTGTFCLDKNSLFTIEYFDGNEIFEKLTDIVDSGRKIVIHSIARLNNFTVLQFTQYSIDE